MIIYKKFIKLNIDLKLFLTKYFFENKLIEQIHIYNLSSFKMNTGYITRIYASNDYIYIYIQKTIGFYFFSLNSYKLLFL